MVASAVPPIGSIAEQDSQHKHSAVYQSGPFRGRAVAYPFNTVLLRLSAIGISTPERQFDETDKEYIVRLDRTYTGLFNDIISSGILGDGE